MSVDVIFKNLQGDHFEFISIHLQVHFSLSFLILILLDLFISIGLRNLFYFQHILDIPEFLFQKYHPLFNIQNRTKFYICTTLKSINNSPKPQIVPKYSNKVLRYYLLTLCIYLIHYPPWFIIPRYLFTTSHLLFWR